jgi:hypothetical protein
MRRANFLTSKFLIDVDCFHLVKKKVITDGAAVYR